MDLELLSLDFDARLQTYCVTARSTYRWFLNATRGAERNLQIQRQIIKGTRAYQTLRADLRRGCVLPPLVLAVTNLLLPADLVEHVGAVRSAAVERTLLDQLGSFVLDVRPDDIYIIDGLQRTNATSQTQAELEASEREVFLSNKLRFELWLNIPFGALAYRMLLLNAGQRPMSIKHQIEVLSIKLSQDLSGIPGIAIITTLEGRRRTRQGQFQLAVLSQAFQAWLQGQPNLDLRNLVMEQLLAESAIETLGASLVGNTTAEVRNSFTSFVHWLVVVDYLLPDDEESRQFLANETVLQGIAAAVGSASRNDTLRERMERGLTRLKDNLQTEPLSDPIGIAEFELLRKGIDPSKVNVGQATRNMVFGAFREYFLSDGTKEMQECWQFAASQL